MLDTIADISSEYTKTENEPTFKGFSAKMPPKTRSKMP